MTAPDLWLGVNVGVDGVDIMAKEMSVVWLVVDFFSLYHRSEVRGREREREKRGGGGEEGKREKGRGERGEGRERKG